jgi:hypothetical protein
MARRRPKERSTADTVVLWLAGTVCTVIILDVIMVFIIVIFKPDENIVGAARNITDIINVLIGALVGYLAGAKTTGKKSEEETELPSDPGEA